ncbi:uncharacterized protein LOC143368463 isoform X2 [Andrena cerasifolii]|uniref:uncharacterized protein LOC143368463 isoform X2 n=1 Tax=Andrena cerasifolii TaxID=2819439 RepID=UPI004037757D
MALKEYLLSTIAITISIGVSSVFAWNPDSHRGPVFYEAYYPDSNEEASNNYDGKRFFDRAAVLEKTYQVPSRRMVFPYNTLRLDSSPHRAESILQDRVEDRPPLRDTARPLDIKEISNLARRAISRDLENWNTLESYLDSVNYQDQSYRRRLVDTGYEPRYAMEQPARGIASSLPGAFREPGDLRGQLYEEVMEEPADPASRIQSPGAQRNLVRRLTARDVSGGSLGPFGSTRYQNQSPGGPGAGGASEFDVSFAKGALDPSSMVGPSEDIFAPRPQVINYIFSRRADAPAGDQGVGAKETKDLPKNYGDNLIREEVKETDEGKDVKVTSIEISEVPKHKTRHHHGEWPKRDYSKRHE